VTRRAESPGPAGEHDQPLLGAGRTADPSEPAARVAAVQIPLDHLFDDRPEEAALLLEPALILRQERRLAELKIRNGSVGTSGSGQQFFYHRGHRYGHVLDPRSGAPAEGVLSVTVLAPNAAEADALATAFFVMGVDVTRAFCESRRDLVAVFVLPGTRTGTVSLECVGEQEPLLVLDVWKDVYETAKDEQIRKIASNHLYQVKAAVDIAALKNAVFDFRARFGRNPMNLDQLVRAGLLRRVPRDFDEKEYVYDPGTGAVTTSVNPWKR